MLLIVTKYRLAGICWISVVIDCHVVWFVGVGSYSENRIRRIMEMYWEKEWKATKIGNFSENFDWHMRIVIG